MQSDPGRVADHTKPDRCQYCGQPVEAWQARECGACYRQANQFPADEVDEGGMRFRSIDELARYQFEEALGYDPDPDYYRGYDDSD